MKNAKKIKMALAYIGKSEAWLAQEFGTSPQNFNKKMSRDTFSIEELEKIASILGADYQHFFEFKDGTQI